MEESILVDGKMVNNMEKVLSILQIIKRRRENGRMDKGRDGLFLRKEMIRTSKKLKINLRI